MADGSLPDALSPASPIPPDQTRREPEDGTALCLSGGGYRAMLFHVGSLWRLNELGYLARLARISSVSGGSIAAGLLGLKWSRLGFGADGVARCFAQEVVAPIRNLATQTLDAWDILAGVTLPGSVGDHIAASYGKHLFGDATLQDLPADPPRFVINATNVQSGALWRFMRPYMRDYRVGEVKNPDIPLAVAVAASSAFPPFLSPVTLRLDPARYTPGADGALGADEAFKSEVVLTDGGVYDNLGLETAWKRYRTILVSDGGGAFRTEKRPNRDWGRHAYRVLSMLYNDVGNLRKRQVIGSLRAELRAGAYWGIRTDITHYGLPDALPCPVDRTLALGGLATRLKALEPVVQERLINWGYAVTDAAMRAHVDRARARPEGFPYAATGV